MAEPMVESATVEDADALATMAGELGYSSTPSAVRRRLAAVLDAADHAVLLARDSDGRPVGWVHVFVALRVESDVFAELGGLVVRADSRRRGVGAKLVAAARRWAAARGIDRLRVRTRVEREDAKAFYDALGFVECKRQRVLERSTGSR